MISARHKILIITKEVSQIHVVNMGHDINLANVTRISGRDHRRKAIFCGTADSG